MAYIHRKSIPEINAGSMADIAFLLLIFFLVSTSMVRKKVIATNLPSISFLPPAPVADRNVLSILINENDDLLVEGIPIEIGQLNDLIKSFVLNPTMESDRPIKPSLANILLKNDPRSSYATYTKIYSCVQNAYREMRMESAKNIFRTEYDLLDTKDRNTIINDLPMKVVEMTIKY